MFNKIKKIWAEYKPAILTASGSFIVGFIIGASI